MPGSCACDGLSLPIFLPLHNSGKHNPVAYFLLNERPEISLFCGNGMTSAIHFARYHGAARLRIKFPLEAQCDASFLEPLWWWRY